MIWVASGIRLHPPAKSYYLPGDRPEAIVRPDSGLNADILLNRNSEICVMFQDRQVTAPS